MNKRKYAGLFFTALTLLNTSNALALSKELALDFGALGKTKVQVSVPSEMISSNQPLPVVVLVSGFQTSKQLGQMMGETFGKNILIAFEYPLEDKINWLDWSNPADGKIASLVPAIPLQIVSLLNWTHGPDLKNLFGVSADPQKINIVTISLGTFFVPMALRLAQLQGLHENCVVFAFGGADLKGVVQNQVKETEGNQIAQFLAPVIQAVTSPFEPTNYIGDVHPQHFLILNAADDQIFTKESQRSLIAAIPEPKEVIEVPGVHIGLNQQERVNSTINTIKAWLLKNNAINN